MGSTAGATLTFTVNMDHPHIHGEHIWSPVNEPVFPGSPPYTWGALDPSMS